MFSLCSWLFAAAVVIVLAIAFLLWNYTQIRRMSEGTSEMVEMAAIIRSGANTFIETEFKVIALIVVAVAAILTLLIEKWSGLTFIVGAFMSSIVCILGMRSATYANVRTANKARETLSIGETVKVALCGGSISGIAVQSFGLLGLITVLYLFNHNGFGGTTEEAEGILFKLGGNAALIRITAYSLGCSLVAMFNRVAGGNYTKAADISSDILAKIRHDLPEDDSRVPNVVADFIGDNVNDIAGNCSDLLESFAATIVAAMMIAVFCFHGTAGNLLNAATIFPLALAGASLVSCVIGILFAKFRKMGDNPAKELNLATWISAGLTIVLSGIACCFLFRSLDATTAVGGMELGKLFVCGWASPWVACVLGIASGIAIGSITEYYTSTDYKPTIQLAHIAAEGEAFVVTKGDAIGSRSCLAPTLVICVALLISGIICGSYGIAIAAVGMLSFVGMTVSIDAFGPIADNAGGLAESCHLPHHVREITDKLDAVGNTTAAIGKGFAIGSAAFATVALIVSFVSNMGPGAVLDFADYVIVSGGIIGGALIEYFSALLTDNTIESAKIMADAGDKLLSIPGVLEGNVKPDYNKMVKMATKEGIRKMVAPSVLALLIPVLGGFLFGLKFVGGILVGATIVAIPRAIFMGNSGGAFDNAKKYIESGLLAGHGKGSAAHKASVTGDTIGDTRKDVVGVALDIFIKMMSTVANTFFVVIQAMHNVIVR